MRKKEYILTIVLAAVVVLAGCNSDKKYNPSKYITKERETSLIDSVVRYAAKLPPGANHKNKFDSTFDEYYKAVAGDYDIREYFISEDSTHYILFTREARSINPMRESIGCKIKFGRAKEFSTYEEVFRTWKMPNNILTERYPVLFDKMVKGENLEPYYSKNKGDQYIEFPDDRFYFDLQERVWKDRVFERDSLK